MIDRAAVRLLDKERADVRFANIRGSVKGRDSKR